jgi:putative mRNA 3-end processing factor
MIQVSFLGAIASVGASGILIDTGVEKLVLDYGTKPRERPPLFPLPIEGKVDAVLISHAHLDHSGGIPLFVARKNSCPIFAPDVTRDLTELLLYDSVKISREEAVPLPYSKEDIKATVKTFTPFEYRKPFKIHQAKITPFDAGHIPGSAMFYIEADGKRLLYTGDLNTIDTRLLSGADLNLPKVDYLITESTYADRDHPNRKSQEKELIRIVQNTLANDGIALLSAFAVSRAQEILLILEDAGIDYPVYMDGMAKKATTIINRYRNLLKEPEKLDQALEYVTYVNTIRQRKKIIKEPCVIITTSGMLQGGPVTWYLKRLYQDETSSLVLTGYQLEDTPGRVLMATGRYITEEIDIEVKMHVRRLDFSSHLGRKELFSFIEHLEPQHIFCIHGDHTEEFAQELKGRGFDAVAPVANNRVFVL